MVTLQELLQQPDFVPVTRSRIVSALRQLGDLEGQTVMVHVRLSAFGWVVGGMDTVVHALRDAVGPAGTLMAFCGWDDSPYHVRLWPEPWQRAYREQAPFDSQVSAARRDFGRFPERLRTWPGALRSNHPEVSFTAVGPSAGELLQDSDNPWGTSGPLGRLTSGAGKVLFLGAPLEKLTLAHHAEATARVEGRRYHEYEMPMRTDSGTEWAHYRTMDTFYGALPYWERDDLNITSPAGNLAEQAVQAGATTAVSVGDAVVTLVEAQPAMAAMRGWLEDHF